MPSSGAKKQPIKLADDGRDPWERQPSESDTMYTSFSRYLALGSARTLAKAAQVLTKNPSYLRGVAAQYRWADRAASWDREQDRSFIEQMAADRRQVARAQLRVGTQFIAKVVARLETLDVETLRPQDLARFADVAIKLQNSGLGLPDRTVLVTGDPTQPVAVADVTATPLAQRREMLEAAMAEMKRRMGTGDGS